MTAVSFWRNAALACGLIALAGSAAPAVGADWQPTRPVRFVVVFPPGGSADILVRKLAEPLSKDLGQPVVVDNRPGAGGMIGLDAVAKAPPDGHMFGLAAAGPPVINPALGVPQPFDPEKDLTPIMQTGEQPNVLIAHPSVPGRITEFVAWLRANPGEPFGTPGAGSTNHITGIAFALALGTTMTHAAYRGTGPAKADLIAGHIKLVIDNIAGDVLSLSAAGKVRPIVVSTAQRSAQLPEVPTMVEATGKSEMALPSWQGIFAPAHLPQPILRRLHRALLDALRSPSVAGWMTEQGATVVGSTPEEFTVFLAEQRVRWGTFVRAGNIKID
ncbi:MAG: tripartite tricarboxylate transporter substrate binding protein [Proteobacteria bacterium]|nr:tripartite tricarboxylate transporter substrate binding protein [Pseudomonadota bacterium]